MYGEGSASANQSKATTLALPGHTGRTGRGNQVPAGDAPPIASRTRDSCLPGFLIDRKKR